jgi:hypothetical protein
VRIVCNSALGIPGKVQKAAGWRNKPQSMARILTLISIERGWYLEKREMNERAFRKAV